MANDGFALSHQAKHSATVAIGRLFRFLSFVRTRVPRRILSKPKWPRMVNGSCLISGSDSTSACLSLASGSGLTSGATACSACRDVHAAQLYFHFFSARMFNLFLQYWVVSHHPPSP